MSELATRTQPPLVEGRGLGKRFGHVEALRDVSFRLEAGEVLALLGDNGAGKSTLIRILSGVYRPTRGELRWDGNPLELHSPQDAHRVGISTVYQDLAVVDLMSVYRNLFLGREDEVSTRIGPVRWMNRGLARREALSAVERVGIRLESADIPVSSLSGGQRQSVAIARAIHFSARLLVLDEPTSALSLRQTDRVLQSIVAAREQGLAVIVITHNLKHVFPIADRFVVLRQGRTAGQFGRGELTEQQIADLITEGKT